MHFLNKLLAIINNKREKNEGKHKQSVVNGLNLGLNGEISRGSHLEVFYK